MVFSKMTIAQDRICDNKTSQQIEQLIKQKDICDPKVFFHSQYKKGMPASVYSTGSMIVVEPFSSISLIPDALPADCVGVTKADGQKCDRCWNFSLSVGTFPHRPLLCKRCVEIIDEGIVDGEIAIGDNGYFYVADEAFTDFTHLPLNEHVDYWCERYGQDSRAGISI
jgi:Zinc finger found in FPG and IleRS